MDHVSERRGDLADAEDAIRSAIFVLDRIAHDEEHRRHVARAIDLYCTGRFEAASALALAIAKARKAPSTLQSAPAPTSIAEIKDLFEGARLTLRRSSHLGGDRERLRR